MTITFQDLKNRILRQHKTPPLTDPELESVFQQALTHIPQEQRVSSEQDLRSIGRLMYAAGERKGQRNIALAPSPLFNPTCGHLMTIYPTQEPTSFILQCDTCCNASISHQNEQEAPNPYKQHLEYMQQQRQQKQALNAKFERTIAQDITPDISQNNTMIQIPTMREVTQNKKEPAFHQPRLQKMEVEDVSWLNSQPVTPEDVLMVTKWDWDATETGLLALPASLKHMRRGA